MGLPYEVRRCIGDVLEAYDRLDINGPKPVLEAFKHFSERYNSVEFQKYLQGFATVASAIARNEKPESLNPYTFDRVYLPNLSKVIAYFTYASNMVEFVRFGRAESMEFKITLCMLATELLNMGGIEIHEIGGLSAGLDQQFLANLPKIE